MLNFLRKLISYDNPLRRAWHFFKGMMAALIYGFPGRKMVCIGVTGTNGKTTTTHLTEHILRGAGYKVGMVSTVQFSINGKAEPNLSKKTTMSPFLTQKFLRDCARQGIQFAVIESSSHALHQFRLWGIPFRVAVLTNITHEHLDYHGTMEKYKEAKKILFKTVASSGSHPEFSSGSPPLSINSTLVLNTADPYFQEFDEIKGPQKITYGFDGAAPKATFPNVAEARIWIRAFGAAYSKFGSSVSLIYGDQKIDVNLKIPGAFNVENTMAATGAAVACGLRLNQLKPALETFEGVPGRMERIQSPKGFEVIVDFGLTPDALEKIYKLIKETALARVIGIIGSCGDRDKKKRPMLGKIVAKHCDLTLVTDEEPYSEDPKAIMEAVLKGALSTGKRKGIEIELIEDRYQAIEYAVAHANAGDTIVITGMGNFTTRTLNQGPIPWDERQVVREIIAKYA